MTFKKVFLLCSVIFFPILVSAKDQVIQFATDPWPPYFLESEHSSVDKGIGVDLVQAVFSRLEGVRPSFPKVPWKRALMEVQSGSKDAVALLLKTPEREEHMLFTVPVIQTEGMLLFHKNRFPQGFEWQTVEDLKPYKLGVVRGYSYGPLLDAFIANHDKVFEVTTSQQLFSMLKRQHIDLISESLSVANGLSQEQGWHSKLGISQKPVNTDVLHFAVSKRSPFAHLLPEMNRIIEQMAKDGEIDKIIGIHGKAVKPVGKLAQTP